MESNRLGLNELVDVLSEYQMMLKEAIEVIEYYKNYNDEGEMAREYLDRYMM